MIKLEENKESTIVNSLGGNKRSKILITSALPYVNNVPHLGTMVCILSADVYTRFQRLKKMDVISVLGTDEHGTTTETIAMKMEMTPQEAVDHFYKIHKDVYDWFNCDFDCFGRTSSPENKEITQDIFIKLKDHGYITENEVEQMFDDEADKYLSDRFIEGECPHCGYLQARGDQCDKCGKLLTPTELINPKSKLTGSKPVIKKTKHLFIKLHQFQVKLNDFIKQREANWSDNAVSTAKAWLKEGLRERAITRDLKWGIPVPVEGYENKVFYVWFDAPIGYIAITKAIREDWRDWWHNPRKVRLVQFMGKDNIPFHSILFPASLIGTWDNYTLIDTLNANEYLNYENDKFSKSRGIGVFGDNAKETGIPADIWRYYIMVNRPEKSDTDFTWKDFQDKINSELVGNLGNLINRTLTFIKKFCDYEVKEIIEPFDYHEDMREIIKEYETIELKKATKLIMALSKKGNQYFQEQEPWKTINENPKKAHNTLAVLVNLIKDLSILLQPIMPKVAEDIQHQLNINPEFNIDALQIKISNHKIGEPAVLFKKLEDEEVKAFEIQFSGKQDKKSEKKSESKINPFEILKKIDLRVAQIKSVEKHPEADKLYIEKIDIGGEERTIVSGLVGHYSPEELVGKKIIVVYNLKPAKLRGILSQGMLLAVSQGDKVGLLLAPDSKSGEKVKFSGISELGFEEQCSEEISIEEFFSVTIKANEQNVVCNEKTLMTTGKIIVDKNLVGKVK